MHAAGHREKQLQNRGGVCSVSKEYSFPNLVWDSLKRDTTAVSTCTTPAGLVLVEPVH